jgi:DNA-binding response OmpR family regulator
MENAKYQMPVGSRRLSTVASVETFSLSFVIAHLNRCRPQMTYSVLVADDEPHIVLSLEFLMRNANYDVRVARNGKEALQAIEERPPDLVLLDVMMPERDGFDVCQTIRANPAWKDMHIILLTAKGRDVEREKGLALGADTYITKPFSTREVLELIEQFRRTKES